MTAPMPAPGEHRLPCGAETVMRLERMGSFHQTRLSFMRSLLRRIAREGWHLPASGSISTPMAWARWSTSSLAQGTVGWSLSATSCRCRAHRPRDRRALGCNLCPDRRRVDDEPSSAARQCPLQEAGRRSREVRSQPGQQIDAPVRVVVAVWPAGSPIPTAGRCRLSDADHGGLRQRQAGLSDLANTFGAGLFTPLRGRDADGVPDPRVHLRPGEPSSPPGRPRRRGSVRAPAHAGDRQRHRPRHGALPDRPPDADRTLARGPRDGDRPGAAVPAPGASVALRACSSARPHLAEWSTTTAVRWRASRFCAARSRFPDWLEGEGAAPSTPVPWERLSRRRPSALDRGTGAGQQPDPRAYGDLVTTWKTRWRSTSRRATRP